MACNDDGPIARNGEDWMKIVAINGSPRKDGNTAKLLKKATEDHKDTDLVYYDLVDMRIKDCIACMHCKKHDECSIKDDMTKIYQDLRECETMVLASPIYMGAETALLKAMVDRMYALLAPAPSPKRYEPRLAPGKKAVAIFTAGNPQANEVMTYMKDRYYMALALQGISKVQVHIVGGTSPASDIMERAESQKVVAEIKKFIEH
jgi:multimeric flavodoxin WrbA